SLVVARENKRESLYMVEVHPEGIDAIINGSGSAAMEAEEYFLHNVSKDKENAKVVALHSLHQYEDPTTMILLSKTAAGVAVGIMQTFW
ncbi:hypothetical protein Tco_0447099, partial [Tanacetum coccineum]